MCIRDRSALSDAREAIVLAPSRDVRAPRPKGTGTMYDELRSRD